MQSLLTYNWNWYAENFINRTKYKINLSTCKQSHVNKNKLINDNWFSEHFSQKLSSQNTRNGISVISNFSGGVCPQVSSRGFTLRHSPETLVIKISWFYIHILKRLDIMTIPKTLYPIKAYWTGWYILQLYWTNNFLKTSLLIFFMAFQYCCDCLNQLSYANILRDVTSHFCSFKCCCGC